MTSHPSVRLVLDNLSTRPTGAIYQTFPAPEARRILRRIELRYTSRHASWLNIVEIEIGVLRSECLDRRPFCLRGRRLGAAAQQLRCVHKLDLHLGKSPRQNGPLYPTLRVISSAQRYGDVNARRCFLTCRRQF
jgi:hypothetical protein